jgi:hypothetical protein
MVVSSINGRRSPPWPSRQRRQEFTVNRRVIRVIWLNVASGGPLGATVGLRQAQGRRWGQEFLPPAACAPLSIGLCSYESTSPHVQSLP